ncbi:MAG TPA: outer membrane lipid asymmetry maintenance protein MlaD [Dissulfurispiraceae bacterium]|nr:outer membrane lipid asymmetry maintenance protein MlaD [Dissulfurispiraceae bacterium]
MTRYSLELVVGFFLVIGILALGYISIRLGKLEVIGDKGYSLTATFVQAGGVKAGAVVEIAGVEVGKVRGIRLDDHYQAAVEMVLTPTIRIQEDAIASVRTKGLIGEKYIQISPGASEQILGPGGKIRDTESAIDIEEIISKYAFGTVK